MVGSITWFRNGYHFHPEFKIGPFIDHNPGIAMGGNLEFWICHCGSHYVQSVE